jgi:hypothetical protein
MKKIVFLLILLLTCCAPAAPTFPPTPNPDKAHSAPTADWSGYQPSVEAFQFNDQCPHLCWLGISPGITTAEDAYKIIHTSDQVKQDSIEATDTGILVNWFTEKTRKLDSRVYVRLDKGVVSTISFQSMAPFVLKNFVALIGEPDGINIDMDITGDIMEMPYGAYYYSKLILISADSADTGLNPNDPVDTLVLNLTYDQKIFRNWVGYGHLKEYFAGKQVHQHPANPQP